MRLVVELCLGRQSWCGWTDNASGFKEGKTNKHIRRFRRKFLVYLEKFFHLVHNLILVNQRTLRGGFGHKKVLKIGITRSIASVEFPESVMVWSGDVQGILQVQNAQ